MPTYVIITEATRTVRVRSTYTIEARDSDAACKRQASRYCPAPDSEETIDSGEKTDEGIVEIEMVPASQGGAA